MDGSVKGKGCRLGWEKELESSWGWGWKQEAKDRAFHHCKRAS